LIAGFSKSEFLFSSNEWQYFGLAYNLNWGGFWLEVCLTTESGNYSSPQLCFQIGYVHRFLD
jgi:hypothetical protein